MIGHVLLVLISIVAGCRPRSFNVDANPEAHTPATPAATACKPVSTWTGRLVLPKADERDGAGSVFIELVNTPKEFSAMRGGAKVRLRFSQEGAVQEWVRGVTRDVKFDAVTEASLARGNLHPHRLNGWKKVGPLESLAGQRSEDDVLVKLPEPRVVSSTLLEVATEPVLISGHSVCLVTAMETKGETLRVRHFDSIAGSFTGSEETMLAVQVAALPGKKTPQSSTRDLEKSSLNRWGWYVYGERKGTQFVVAALQPRRLFLVEPSEFVVGREEVREFGDSGVFKDLQFGNWKTVFVDTNGLREQTNTLAQAQARADALWRLGKRALVIHVFGWRGGANAEPGGFTAGHFSFGVAEIVRDAFTGQRHIEIEYKQVYGHNREGIISGSHAWHSYMGDLRRGWMYTIPVSDTLVETPQLNWTYDFGGKKYSPLDGLARELEKMTARYRVGPGNGAASVTPATSCVQDSHAALWAAMIRFQKYVATDAEISAWLKKNPQTIDARFFADLGRLADDMRRSISPFAGVPVDWENNTENLAVSRRDPGMVGNVVEGLRLWRTLLPRRTQREHLQMMTRYGSPMWSIRTDGIGGHLDGLVPLAPQSIL